MGKYNSWIENMGHTICPKCGTEYVDDIYNLTWNEKFYPRFCPWCGYQNIIEVTDKKVTNS